MGLRKAGGMVRACLSAMQPPWDDRRRTLPGGQRLGSADIAASGTLRHPLARGPKAIGVPGGQPWERFGCTRLAPGGRQTRDDTGKLMCVSQHPVTPLRRSAGRRSRRTFEVRIAGLLDEASSAVGHCQRAAVDRGRGGKQVQLCRTADGGCGHVRACHEGSPSWSALPGGDGQICRG